MLFLGFRWNKESYASDYFQNLYEWAIKLIKKGFAYIDTQSKYDIKFQRKDSFESGINSINRKRSINENLDLFEKMKNGFFREGTCVLRAKIDMSSPNINMRDPIMYRILYKTHHKTGSKWCIYPTYDWTHGQCDYIEQISHSLCSLEFENKRPLYNWFLEKINLNTSKIRPKQIEFSRLNISNTVTSKRKIQYLIKKNIIYSWDDPRILTICGLKKRGYPSIALKDFIHKIGITKRNSMIDISLLEYWGRKHLNKISTRVMVVLNPVKIIIDNYCSNKIEWIKLKNNPEDKHSGIRNVPFSKNIYIEESDFLEEKKDNFFRLFIGNKVRLKGSYVIEAKYVVKNEKGKIKEIHCNYFSKTESIKKIRSTLHWVSIPHIFPIKINIYKTLFLKKKNNKLLDEYEINPNSKKTIIGYAEPFLKKVKKGDYLQFQRIGYFCVEEVHNGKIILNKTLSIKNKWE